MSVRVVARIRPLLKHEISSDTIVHTDSTSGESSGKSVPRPNVVRIPNPRNGAESFAFQFNSVYDQSCTQQDIFDSEVAPTVKHLFSGYDVTLFAYGVTGTGKTHTMRGGKSLAERGVIPRLLSSIYRRCRKIEKDSEGATELHVAMSYYEIYNDRVYDLFQSPDKRTAAGLPIRDNGGKTIVCGLTERPCTTLKEFEKLYDEANINRSTSATKLNAHSSRSHAILCVKLTQTTGDRTLVSTASAIDLAGSEDNRRTDNNKERMVESGSINKSLFVLAQCVEAISKKQSRIPYRESKMTRILSLGQNDGLTVMFLNLAPVRSYHLDTLSSLNFANRTKKIEVNEIENEPMFRTTNTKATHSLPGPSINRQPLRPLAVTRDFNAQIPSHHAQPEPKPDKPPRTFSVYTDKNKPSARPLAASSQRKNSPYKRPLNDSSSNLSTRPIKSIRSNLPRSSKPSEMQLSKASIEQMVGRLVEEKLAERTLAENNMTAAAVPLPDEIQRRLDVLEARVTEREDSEGLQYLLMARQHAARGEDPSALRMYQLALPFFPGNHKLLRKIEGVKGRLRAKNEVGRLPGARVVSAPSPSKGSYHMPGQNQSSKPHEASHDQDDDFYPDAEGGNDDSYDLADELPLKKPRRKPVTANTKLKLSVFNDADSTQPPTPRTARLLDVINSRDVGQIRALKGVGAKRAESIVNALCEMDDEDRLGSIHDLGELGALKGVGGKMVEKMRVGMELEGF
ncbi:kinesin-II 95 kDa subunit [Eremomyces bilateralis CBS 781.70]|uniref:Kinesin-like protein KIF22 n=1 Tax=Eremomyces bilateralis CBS 781.70 TaxID=1392243 RepID=A0A6G1FUD3_9PEZI|nr:kinesin-II 95 kDa subunit [Eremomyces bilateralis CBS 781.70]KAF1809373.1 kinesin-II 95 kDa subunit [Eremomyces bilateralis CBS 781.70]